MRKPRNGFKFVNPNKPRTKLHEEDDCDLPARGYARTRTKGPSLILSLRGLVFLVYFTLRHSHGDEGNFHPDKSSLALPAVYNDSIGYSADASAGNGSNNHSFEMPVGINSSTEHNDSLVYNSSVVKTNYPAQGMSGLEVGWSFLGYTDLVCDSQSREMRKIKESDSAGLEEAPSERTHPIATFLNLDDFRNSTKLEKGWRMPSELANITRRLEPDGKDYNYALASKGAKVVAHNKEAKGANNILGKDHDKYLRNPCSVGVKFVVVELAEETLVDAIKIANVEHYSSNFKEFKLSGSMSYPIESFYLLGSFVALNVKHAQTFKLPEPKWARYLKLDLLSHYGSEFYCTLSVFEVYGIDAIERMLEDLIVSSEDSTPNAGMPLNLVSGPTDGKISGEINSKIEHTVQGIKNDTEPHEKKADVMTKDPVVTNKVLDPIAKVRQSMSGRIPGDNVLKILMQKVMSLEVNLSALEDFVKELNRQQADIVPEIDKELSRISLLLEKCRKEVKDILKWKERVGSAVTDLEAWKLVITSQVGALIRENTMLRQDLEKIACDHDTLKNKEVAVLAWSLCIALIAIIKLASGLLVMLFGGPSHSHSHSEKDRTSRGWVFIFLSCSVTVFIALLYR